MHGEDRVRVLARLTPLAGTGPRRAARRADQLDRELRRMAVLHRREVLARRRRRTRRTPRMLQVPGL